MERKPTDIPNAQDLYEHIRSWNPYNFKIFPDAPLPKKRTKGQSVAKEEEKEILKLTKEEFDTEDTGSKSKKKEDDGVTVEGAKLTTGLWKMSQHAYCLSFGKIVYC